MVLALDAANAFNEVHRAAIAREAADRTPALKQLVAFCYGQPTKLLVVDQLGGVEHIQSSQGVQQGCNLGTLMMSLVMARRVGELLEAVPELDADSYVDDVFGLANLQDPQSGERG